VQISQITRTELSLLIAGLRAIHVADSEDVRRKLAIQLENELSTRYSLMVGSWSEQERSTSDDGSFVAVPAIASSSPEYQSPLGSRNVQADLS
jgi:hypothetical protein